MPRNNPFFILRRSMVLQEQKYLKNTMDYISRVASSRGGLYKELAGRLTAA